MLTQRDESLWLQLQETPIEVEAAAAFLRDPRAGGIDLFLGITRQWTGDAETVLLSYEAFEPMALRELARLAGEVRAQWPVLRVCILHRLGVVPTGETSVVIGVATAHRAEAFEACRWLIDHLKQDVPIWKREHYRDGRTEWVEEPPRDVV